MKKAIVSLIFFTLFVDFYHFQAHPIDITTSFSQTVVASLPAGTQVLYSEPRQHPSFKQIMIIAKNAKIIGTIEYSSISYDTKSLQWISNLHVTDEFQKKGYGSALLRYVLTQCIGKCTETKLQAFPTAQENPTVQDYKKLKEFYIQHGGNVSGPEFKNSGYFTFKAHDKK